MRSLVTGGAGFLGSHVVEVLVARGDSVRVLDNLSSGRLENLSSVARGIEFIEGDVRDSDACRSACRGIHRVWHLAASVSVPQSLEDPLTTHEVNSTGTLRLLLAARDSGAERFVVASSCAVYGDNPQLPCTENDPTAPMSPYAVSKLDCEHFARVFWQLYRMETVALRYFNIYGPRQDADSHYAAVVPKFLSALTSGRAPTVFGNGEQSREFTFVRDCAEAALLAGNVGGQDMAGETFNIAVGRATTVNELLAAMQRELGVSLPAVYAPERPGEIRFSQANIQKAADLLGFTPRWSLEEGIHETAEWFLSRRP